MQLEHRLSALLQLHLHSPLNTWFEYIAQRQLQAETGNSEALGFGASYIRDFTVAEPSPGWCGVNMKLHPRRTMGCNYPSMS